MATASWRCTVLSCLVCCASKVRSMMWAALKWPVGGRGANVDRNGVWLLLLSLLLSLSLGEGGKLYSVGLVVSLLTDGDDSWSVSMAVLSDEAVMSDFWVLNA